MRDSLRACIVEYPGSVVTWESRGAIGFDAWLGVAVPDIGWTARAWEFDVTGPGGSAGDPLALELDHDLVEVVVYDRTRPRVRGRMVADRPDGVTEIHVPSSAWPPNPWCVEVDLGWSWRSVSDAVARWFADVAGRRDVLVVAVDDEMPTTPVHAVSEIVQATSVAFDGLLTLDPADAAVICTTLTAVAEALAA